MNEKPMAVHEVVNLTGITARTLHYYDEIGLLKQSIVCIQKMIYLDYKKFYFSVRLVLP